MRIIAPSILGCNFLKLDEEINKINNNDSLEVIEVYQDKHIFDSYDYL